MLGTWILVSITSCFCQIPKAYLNCLHGVKTVEDRVEEGDLVDNHLGTTDVNAVTNIVRVLDEKENAGTQELLSRDSENEREREQRSSRSSQSRDETALEEGN